jgi:sugar/nucleoside kinase (ribokinase family)
VEDTFCGPIPALPPAGALHVLPNMPIRVGGCAANVAIDLTKQGIAVDLVGCVGRDGAADLVCRTLASHGVGLSQLVRDSKFDTSKTVVLLLGGEDRRYLHVVGANRGLRVEHLSRHWVSELNVFYLGGLFALPGIDLHALGEFLRFCRASRVMTVVDVVCPQQPHGVADLRSILPAIDVFLPNEDEARVFTGVSDPFDQLQAFRKAGANTVIITRGREGAVAIQKDRIFSCGTYQMPVIDPSGSGDAFASGAIRGLLLGWDMPRILQYASVLGASATRSIGTTDSVFSTAEAELFIEQLALTVTERSAR